MRLGKIIGIIVASIIGMFIFSIVSLSLYLSVIGINDYKELINERVKEATGRDLVIAGPMELSLALIPVPGVTFTSLSDVSFSNADWGSRKEMAILKKIEVQVSLLPLLWGTIQIDRVGVKGLDALIETNKSGQGNWEIIHTEEVKKEESHEREEKAEAGNLPVLKEIVFEDIKITYKDGVSGQSKRMTIESLTAHTDSASNSLQIALKMALNGAPVALDASVGSTKDLLSYDKPFPFDAKLSAFNATALAKGSITDITQRKGISLTVGMTIPNLAKTFTTISKALPEITIDGLAETTVNFSSKINGISGDYTIENVNLKAGSSDLTGNATIKLGDISSVVAMLTSHLINSKDFISKKTATKKKTSTRKKKSAKKKKIFSADPFPFDTLRKVKINAKFNSTKIIVGNIMIKHSTNDLQLQDGKLTFNQTIANIADGTLKNKISLDISKGKSALLSSKLDIANLKIGKLLKDITGNNIIAGGSTIVTANLTGKGRSPASLMGRLNGHILAKVGQGTLDKNNINLLGGELLTQTLTAFISKNSSKEKANSKLTCAVVNAKISDGIINLDKAIGIETSAMLVSGNGEINLKKETLDLEVSPRMTQTVGIGIGGLAELVKVTGTLAEPSIGINIKEAAKKTASIAGAIMTSGISLLAEKAVDSTVLKDNHPCTTAINKK